MSKPTKPPRQRQRLSLPPEGEPLRARIAELEERLAKAGKRTKPGPGPLPKRGAKAKHMLQVRITDDELRRVNEDIARTDPAGTRSAWLLDAVMRKLDGSLTLTLRGNVPPSGEAPMLCVRCVKGHGHKRYKPCGAAHCECHCQRTAVVS